MSALNGTADNRTRPATRRPAGDRLKVAKPIERAFLGGLLKSPSAIAEVRHVKAEDFQYDPHQRVYRATLRVADRDPSAVGVASVAAEIRRDPSVTTEQEAERLVLLVAELPVEAPFAGNLRYYADQVIGLSVQRDVGDLADGLRVEADSLSGPIVQVLGRARAKLDRLAARTNGPADNPLVAGAMDCAAFNAAEHRHQWLIGDVMVANEPLVLAGPSKTMKTALVVEAAVSLASGASFLDLFPVSEPGTEFKPRSVFVLSAESGAASLQARMRQVCRAKGVEPSELPIQWFTRVQKLDTVEGCRNLEAALRHFGSEAAILDPSYLLIGGEATADLAGNLYKMGPLLAAVGDACLAAGATPIVVTHSNARVEVGKPMELSHIAFSGFQQWARQWWLLSRRAEYRDDGRHELLFRFGGSAGHTGLVNLDIDEGTFDRSGGSRRWDVRGQHANEARRAQQEERQAEELRQLHEHADKVQGAMVKILATGNSVATRNALKELTGLKPAEVTAAVAKLVGDGSVVETNGDVKCGHGSTPVVGIRRPDGWSK